MSTSSSSESSGYGLSRVAAVCHHGDRHKTARAGGGGGREERSVGEGGGTRYETCE